MLSDDLDGLAMLLRTAEETGMGFRPVDCGRMADLLARHAGDVRAMEAAPLDVDPPLPANVVPLFGGAT